MLMIHERLLMILSTKARYSKHNAAVQTSTEILQSRFTLRLIMNAVTIFIETVDLLVKLGQCKGGRRQASFLELLLL